MTMTALLSLLIAFGPLQDDDIRPEKVRELEELRGEVQALAKLNQAKVTKDQAQELLEVIEGARDLLEELVDSYEDELDQATALLKEHRDELAKGKTLSAESLGRLQSLQQQIAQGLQQIGAELAKTADDVKEILSEEQLLALAVSGNDPWIQLRQKLNQGISQVRNLSEDEFEIAVPDAIEMQLEEISERFGGLDDDEFIEEHDRIMEILREARDLDDDEFDSEATKLVRKILNEGKLGEYGKKMTEQTLRRGGGLEQVVGKFLYSPLTIRALKAKAQAEEEKEGWEDIPTEDDE
jgi:hypothetical protein